jgi:hypothetical protein
MIMVKDWIATPLGFGKQDGRLKACLSCLIADSRLGGGFGGEW